MKRCFSVALILALLGTTVVSPAWAEELEVISEEIEPSVSEVEVIDAPEFIGESSEEAPQETSSEAVEEAAPDVVVQGDIPEATGAESNSLEEEASQPEAEAEPQAATGIELSRKSITIGLKEKYKRLTVVALPEGSVLPAISWRSSNTKYVKVSKSGVITGVKKGSATIYARMEGSDEEVKCKVTVKKAPKKVSIKPTSLTLGAGMTYQFKASVPSGYGSGGYTYSSSKTAVATIDNDGVVTAIAPGTTTITVKAFNGKKAKCKLNVMGEPASVAFPDTIIPLAVGQTTSLSANAVTKDNEVTPSSITYAIDDASPDAGCVVLDEATGKITGVRRGEAVIRGTAHNGAVGYCEVEVDVAPADITLNKTSISIGVKEVYIDLLAELTPPDGELTCAQTITWSSSNKKIAKVNSVTGAITGVKDGSCTIKAVVPGGKSAQCKVKVLKAPGKKQVSISPANGSLNVGQNGQYKITMTKGYGGSLIYESSNTDVATIDNSGIVTALAAGKTVITVTTYNGIKKTATLVVNSDIGTSTDTSASDGSKSGDDEKIKYVIKIAKEKKGMPYVYGSFGPNSFDCSGFVYWCFKQINIKLKDSAYKQGYDNRYPKISYGDLQPGDLVFFNTVDDKDLSDHSGLFIGNGKFIHASSSAGEVIISKMTSGYYKRNFSWGRRVFK